MNRKSRGAFAEDYASELLSKNGYKILKRNYTTAFSEIDIIAVKNGILVFIEVKARWGLKFGKPEEAVDSKKLFKIRKAGELFYLKYPNLPKKSRIDVVSLILTKDKVISEKIIKVF